MIIEEKDFRLTSISDNSPLFDLELLYTVKPKGKPEREEFKNVAYGIPLDSALQRIVSYRVNNRYDCPVDLVTYINAYIEETESLKHLCE